MSETLTEVDPVSQLKRKGDVPSSVSGISLILPAKNEAGSIFNVTSNIISYCEALTPLPYEVIIIDDGSTDDSQSIINRLQELYPDKVVSIVNPRNRGYGFAIRQGIIRSRYNLIFFTDADGQFDIRDLGLLLPLIKSGVPDIVVGYRMDRQDPWIRLFLSGCYNILVRHLFRISVKDVDCAFKVFHKDIFNKITIRSKNFFVNTEILAKAIFYGYRIVEIGVDHLPRTAGESTVSFRHVPMTIRELTRIWLEMRHLEKEKNT